MQYLNEIIGQFAIGIGLSASVVSFISHAILTLLVIAVAMLIDYLCRRLIVPIILRLAAKTETDWDDRAFSPAVLVSLCHIVSAVIVWKMLPPVFNDYPTIADIVGRLAVIYITVMAVRSLLVFIDSFKNVHSTKNVQRQQYLMSACGVMKIVIIFIAVIIIVATLLDKSPKALLAGIGATSAVLMLVFKDTIEGFVAGIRLTSNEMIHIGDWITVPGTSADGMVEEITLSTVKIRNFDNTTVTVSPQALLSGSFQNWNTMFSGTGRRASRVVYFDFNSVRIADKALVDSLMSKGYISENLISDSGTTASGQQPKVTNATLFRLFMEDNLRSRPEVNTDMYLVVRQKEALAGGMPIEFVFNLRAKDSIPYEHALANIMEYIYATAPEFGLKIYQQMALPTATA